MIFNYNSLAQFELVLFFVAGAIVLGIHVGLYLYNQFIFTIFLSIVVIAYVITVILIINGIKTKLSAAEFSSINYLSFYTIFLQAFLILFALGAWMIRSRVPTY